MYFLKFREVSSKSARASLDSRFRGNDALFPIATATPALLDIASLLNDCHDVFFAHHEQFFAADLDALAGVFTEQDAIADLDVERAHLAVFKDLAVADCQDFALIRLFRGGFRKNDAGRSFGFLVQTLD